MLIVRSFQKLQGEDRGFDPRHVLSFTVPFPDFKFAEARQKAAFIRNALANLRAIPGVVAAGATTTEPLFTGTMAAGFNVEGKPAANERGAYLLHHRIVTPGYLESLRVPLLAGRFLDARDRAGGPRTVVVSRSLAERYWPGVPLQSVPGRRVKRGPYDSRRPWLTVVGVAGSLAETHDEVLGNDDAWYLPYEQLIDEIDSLTFTLRTRGQPLALAPAARDAVHAADKDEPLYSLMTMEQRFVRRTTPARFATAIYTAFGLLGLVLAAIGIYGVLAFSVNQRRREIGIRGALGAQPGQIRSLVLGSALRLAGAGLALGVAGALALTRFLSSQLYQVSPRDPVALAAALLGLAAISLLSSYLPARRAARIDPVGALRGD